MKEKITENGIDYVLVGDYYILSVIIKQMQKAESVTEEMKENDQWE